VRASPGIRRTSNTTRTSLKRAWRVAAEAIAGGKYRLVILDELDLPVHVGLGRHRRGGGCAPRPARRRQRDRDRARLPGEIVEIADTVTEMRKVKHAYDKGIAAKKGIEY
jgi:cob(I)alamin adenosyltransferase